MGEEFEVVEPEKSHIKRYGYRASDGTLFVEFEAGRYEFAPVPGQVFMDMSEAESTGKFFQENIKSKFQMRKIEAEPEATTAS